MHKKNKYALLIIWNALFLSLIAFYWFNWYRYCNHLALEDKFQTENELQIGYDKYVKKPNLISETLSRVKQLNKDLTKIENTEPNINLETSNSFSIHRILWNDFFLIKHMKKYRHNRIEVMHHLMIENFVSSFEANFLNQFNAEIQNYFIETYKCELGDYRQKCTDYFLSINGRFQKIRNVIHKTTKNSTMIKWPTIDVQYYDDLSELYHYYVLFCYKKKEYEKFIKNEKHFLCTKKSFVDCSMF